MVSRRYLQVLDHLGHRIFEKYRYLIQNSKEFWAFLSFFLLTLVDSREMVIVMTFKQFGVGLGLASLRFRQIGWH